MTTSITLTCQRCGFIATNKQKLLKHWKTEVQCPALYSKTKHQDLIEQVKPKPTIEQRTCPHCNKVFQSIGGMKIHANKCKSNSAVGTSSSVHVANENNEETVLVHNAEPDNKSKKAIASLSDLRKRKQTNYVYSSVSTSNELQAFDKEINWKKLGIHSSHILNLCRKKAEGIVDLFIELHNYESHDNIRWFYDNKQEQYKLIAYNGTKWIDINQKLITQHLWLIYSFLEEYWCDYQSAIRCNAVNDDDILTEREQQSIDEFYYDTIVDDESVFFYCKDMFYEYMEAIKTI